MERKPDAEVRLTFAPPHYSRSVMVPLDGSSFAEHALPLALEIARRDEARLLVVHVHSVPYLRHALEGLWDGARPARQRRKCWDYLDGVVARLAKISSVPVTPVLLEENDIAAALYGMANAGADLVVMSTHARRMWTGLWRGQIADTLMQRLSVPLILLRGHEEAPDLSVQPAIGQVVIALDGSTFSEQVLRPVAAWRTLTDAECTLLRVIDPAVVPLEECVTWRMRADHLLRQAAAQARIRPGTQPEERRALRSRASFLVEDDASQGILDYAHHHGADLIALATWGREGLSRWFRGSVADRIIRGASVPVLVYRPPEL